MENKFRRKLKKYSSFNSVQNGGVTVELKNTQQGLLKSINRLNIVKVPPKDTLNKTFEKLNEEVDRIGEIFKDNKFQQKTEHSSILESLSNYDKYLNDVPDVFLDFSHNFGKENKVNPLQRLNISSLEFDIKKLGEDIKFNERNEKINVDSIKQIKVNDNPIKFDERLDKITIKPIQDIEVNSNPIIFNQRTQTVSINPIQDIEINSNPIIFNPRTQTVSINPIQDINVNAETIVFKPRDEIITLENLMGINVDLKKVDFKKREESVDMSSIKLLDDIITETNFDEDDMKTKMSFNAKFFDSNKQTIIDRMTKLNKAFEQIDIIKSDLLVKIEYFKLQINITKIQESIQSMKIEKGVNKEKIEVDGLEEDLSTFIPKIKDLDPDSKKTLNKRNYWLETIDFDLDDKFPFDLLEEGNPKIQLGGTLEKFIDLSKEYEHLISKKKTVIKDFRKVINEYNILFIQYFNYKFYILKNINKFHLSKREIYQFIKYSTMKRYLKILTHLNNVISNPRKIFETKTPVAVNNAHMIIYFKHFLIIKQLYGLFDTINNAWEKTDKKDDSYMIDIFKNENIYFIIFNLYYKILDNYDKTFLFL
jgi:hypothetical protein